MTVDANVAGRRMPGAVLAAAILLGFAGGLFGLALLALGLIGISGGPVMAALGALVLTLTVLAVVGLAKGNRSGQLASLLISVGMVLANLYTLSQGSAISIIWIGLGVAVAMLVVVPISVRNWFAG